MLRSCGGVAPAGCATTADRVAQLRAPPMPALPHPSPAPRATTRSQAPLQQLAALGWGRRGCARRRLLVPALAATPPDGAVDAPPRSAEAGAPGRDAGAAWSAAERWQNQQHRVERQERRREQPPLPLLSTEPGFPEPAGSGAQSATSSEASTSPSGSPWSSQDSFGGSQPGPSQLVLPSPPGLILPGGVSSPTATGSSSSSAAGSSSSTASRPAQALVGSSYDVVLPRHEPFDPSSIPEVFGNVHSTESMSAVDGPGVRFLVFVQGCAMRCLFCSNPDTWQLKGGEKTSSKELASQIRKVKNYLKPRGGVTISGGEAMLQPHFVASVFQEVHAMGLNTTIDTTGQGTKQGNWDVVLPHTDLVLFCIKHIDPLKYEALTGLKQKGALKFADELAERNIPFYLRYVLIPGYTDGPKDLKQLIAWCTCQPTLQGIELLPYHVLGRNKWEAMGIPYPLDGVQTPPRRQVDEFVAQFTSSGIPVIVPT